MTPCSGCRTKCRCVINRRTAMASDRGIGTRLLAT
jgi:hypothetical protein